MGVSGAVSWRLGLLRKTEVVRKRPFLYDRIGIRTLALHPGKWDAIPTGMCTRVPLVELYFPSRGGVKGV